MTAAVWSSSSNGAIYIFHQNYITINGDILGGTQGVIQATANGTGLTNSVPGLGICSIGGIGITVKNLSISNLYVRIAGSDENAGTATLEGAIVSADQNGSGTSNLTVTNCVIHDALVGIDCDYSNGDSTYTFIGNTIYNCNWGIGCGDRGSIGNTLNGLVVTGNHFYGWSNWNDTLGNNYHHNGIFLFANSGTATSSQITSNTFGPGWGGAYQTSGIYMNGNIAGTNLITNNIFVCNGGETVGNGLITVQTQLTASYGIYHNTLIGGGTTTCIDIAGYGATGGSAHTATFNINNNLGAGGGGGIFISLNYNSGTIVNSANNLAYDYGATPFFNSTTTSGSPISTTTWQALGAGFDANLLISNPLLNSTYTPASNSPARGAGTPISTVPTDAANRGRPAIPAIGAYEYYVTGLSGRISGYAITVAGP